MRAQGYCAAVAAWLLAGCTTNYYLVDEMAARPPQAYPETVQLVPSAVAKASALLQQTTLYRTAPQAAVTLRDANLQFSGGCGNPLLASGLTLGLLPVSIPEGGRLVYRLQRDGQSVIYAHDIWVERRTSVWEWLFTPFADSENEVWQQGLQRAPRHVVNCIDGRCTDPEPTAVSQAQTAP